MGADYQFYYADKISKIIKKCKSRRVIEIGGGYGGMAYYLMKTGKVDQYIDIDLPETLALATFYLMSAYPNENFLLYGEGGIDSNSDNVKFVMLPSFEIEKIKKTEIGLAFNSYSFAEMSKEASVNYIQHIGMLRPEHILHVNHTSNSTTKSDEFHIERFGYTLNSRMESLWNFGRSSTADEFEYHYKINSTLDIPSLVEERRVNA